MVAHDHRLADMARLVPTPVRNALVHALAMDRTKATGVGQRRPSLPQASLVQSVQRMRLPPQRDASWAAAEYARWLPSALQRLVRVEVDDDDNIRIFKSLRGLTDHVWRNKAA